MSLSELQREKGRFSVVLPAWECSSAGKHQASSPSPSWRSFFNFIFFKHLLHTHSTGTHDEHTLISASYVKALIFNDFKGMSLSELQREPFTQKGPCLTRESNWEPYCCEAGPLPAAPPCHPMLCLLKMNCSMFDLSLVDNSKSVVHTKYICS